jgi:hypothetical protein
MGHSRHAAAVRRRRGWQWAEHCGVSTPCGGASPIGDVTHIGSLVFGVWALYESGRALRQPRVRNSPVRPRGAQSTEATPVS